MKKIRIFPIQKLTERLNESVYFNVNYTDSLKPCLIKFFLMFLTKICLFIINKLKYLPRATFITRSQFNLVREYLLNLRIETLESRSKDNFHSKKNL